MNELLEKKKSVEQDIKGLEVVLQSLDEQLENLEEQCLPQNRQQVKSELSLTEPQHEDFMSSTQRNPDELLTDPLTQHVPSASRASAKAARVSLDTHMHTREDELDVLSAASPHLKRAPPRTASVSSATGSVGQLEITKLPAKKKKKPAKGPATIDHFFGTSSSAPSNTHLLQSTTRPAQNSISSNTATGRNDNRSFNNNNHNNNKSESNNFHWSHQVQQLLQNTFRIQQFRENQREVINCTLSGQDVFVLMRTGGGKSLTYQLPAVLEQRQNRKVTLVISPLLSLIKDQEDQMNQFVPGSAVSFSSNLPGGQTEHNRRWNLVRDPSRGVCLIFVTPEKVHKSQKLKNELQKLQDQGRLGRFVVDEAHCCSNWVSTVERTLRMNFNCTNPTHSLFAMQPGPRFSTRLYQTRSPTTFFPGGPNYRCYRHSIGPGSR